MKYGGTYSVSECLIWLVARKRKKASGPARFQSLRASPICFPSARSVVVSAQVCHSLVRCFGISGLVKGPAHEVVLVHVCGVEIKSVAVPTNGVVIAVRITQDCLRPPDRLCIPFTVVHELSSLPPERQFPYSMLVRHLMASVAPAARVAFVVEVISGLQRLQREMARLPQGRELREQKARSSDCNWGTAENDFCQGLAVTASFPVIFWWRSWGRRWFRWLRKLQTTP